MQNGIKLGAAAAVIVTVILTSMPYFGFSGKDGCDVNSGQSDVLRIGYFPNINHAQAVIGLGRGDFQQVLEGIRVETTVFSAGPAVIEAINAKAIDVAYVGPNPAVNGYVESDGCNLRIVSGASSGGAVFVVRNGVGIESEDDLANRKFASPQLGNTQDVALRKYLLDNGYQTKENGGSVEVLPVKNADALTLLEKKEIDGAWVPEPWGAKMVKEVDARIFLNERDLWPDGEFVTAHIIVRTEYLENNPETISRLLEAHVEQTMWINENADEAMQVFNAELEKLTGKTIPEDEFEEGFSRMALTWDPVKESLFQSADDAFEIDFLRAKPDAGIYDLEILNQVLRDKGLPEIQ